MLNLCRGWSKSHQCCLSLIECNSTHHLHQTSVGVLIASQSLVGFVVSDCVTLSALKKCKQNPWLLDSICYNSDQKSPIDSHGQRSNSSWLQEKVSNALVDDSKLWTKPNWLSSHPSKTPKSPVLADEATTRWWDDNGQPIMQTAAWLVMSQWSLWLDWC